MLHKAQKENPERLLAKVQKLVDSRRDDAHEVSDQLVKERNQTVTIPASKFYLRETSMLPATAADVVRRLLTLDGKMSLNLASFVTTVLDKEGIELCAESLTKNLADSDEYPAMTELEQRCVSIISNLWNVSEDELGVGTATTGSSEAIHLGGLAMKRRWEERQKANGRPSDKPNVIMGANAQVALLKFARYFDVEARILDVHAKDHFSFSMDDMKKHCDENTIGVFAILGSTYTGHYQNVEQVSQALDEVEKEHGWDIPIHVDGASGAMISPFLSPDLKWDFRLDRVKSINTSGHKFGLAPVGCGWIIWRDQKYLPESLLFTLQYLGGSEVTYTLNFSRPSHPIIYQYYALIKNGRRGFQAIHGGCMAMARLLSIYLENTEYFQVLSDIHRPRGEYFSDKPKQVTDYNPSLPDSYYNDGLPVVSFGFTPEFQKKHPEIPQEAVSAMMRSKGYIIPNYPMPKAEEKTEVLRVVVNASLTADFMDQLMEDLGRVVNRLLKVGDSGKLKDVLDIHRALAIVSAADHDEIEHELDWREKGTGAFSRC